MLDALSGPGPVSLVKRCLDLSDLLATAATGTAQVAVVSDQLPGLDADSIDRLARDGVRTVVVTAARNGTGGRRSGEEPTTLRARLHRMGATRVLDEGAVASLIQHLLDAAEQELRPGIPTDEGDVPDVPPEPQVEASSVTGRGGRLVAVWGPTGGPGRTTVAIGLAAEWAARGQAVTLVDADPYGGAVGQHLAVLDEVSGLLAAARLANTGQLDPARLAGLGREISPRLRLLTGLPRPDRWTEVRPQALGEVLAAARLLDELVVVDTGFGLPATPLDPFAAGPGRDEITLAALARADELVVVGSADPVGLTRLVRSLRDVADVRPSGVELVAVNRMRNTLGWSPREIGDLVAHVAPRARLVFLPDDRIAVDRAMVAGRTLLESGDSPLRRALADLAGALLPQPA